MRLEKARKEGYYVANHAGMERLHSAYSPRREAKQLIPNLSGKPEVLIVFGAGLGYILDQIAKKWKNAAVIVFEPHPELLEEGYKQGVWTENDFKNLEIIGPDAKNMLELLGEFIPLEKHNSYTIIQWPDYQKKKSDYFKRAAAVVKRLRQYYEVNLNTLRENGSEWLDNLLANFKMIKKSKEIVFPETPTAIAVVGAGPCLDEQIEWLKENEDKLFIFCVNTAGPILKKQGIRVDVHAAMDSNALVAEDIYHSEVKHLLLSPFVKPDLSSNHPDSFSLLALRSPLTEWMLAAPFLPQATSGGSVTVTLLDLLFRKSNGPIFLLGGDMEFKGGRYYARGTWREERLLERVNRFNSFLSLLFNWQKEAKNKGQKENPRFKDEREWLNMQTQSQNRIWIPGPKPSWWKGPDELPEINSAGQKPSIRPVAATKIDGWLKEQYELFNAAKKNSDPGCRWGKFCFWVEQICENPEEILQRFSEALT